MKLTYRSVQIAEYKDKKDRKNKLVPMLRTKHWATYSVKELANTTKTKIQRFQHTPGISLKKHCRIQSFRNMATRKKYSEKGLLNVESQHTKPTNLRKRNYNPPEHSQRVIAVLIFQAIFETKLHKYGIKCSVVSSK